MPRRNLLHSVRPMGEATGPPVATALAPDLQARLWVAVAEVSWLLERGYSQKASVQLVGNHHQLEAWQRIAVQRCACSDAAGAQRRAAEVASSAIRGNVLEIDAYNVLTTVLVAQGGGLVLVGRDGCYRDLASLHGKGRTVGALVSAIEWTGVCLSALGPRACRWVVDRPVARSAVLVSTLKRIATENGWDWSATLAQSADGVLVRSQAIIATSDAAVLDRCRAWFNLARHVIEVQLPNAYCVDLGVEP